MLLRWSLKYLSISISLSVVIFCVFGLVFLQLQKQYVCIVKIVIMWWHTETVTWAHPACSHGAQCLFMPSAEPPLTTAQRVLDEICRKEGTCGVWDTEAATPPPPTPWSASPPSSRHLGNGDTPPPPPPPRLFSLCLFLQVILILFPLWLYKSSYTSALMIFRESFSCCSAFMYLIRIFHFQGNFNYLWVGITSWFFFFCVFHSSEYGKYVKNPALVEYFSSRIKHLYHSVTF